MMSRRQEESKRGPGGTVHGDRRGWGPCEVQGGCAKTGPGVRELQGWGSQGRGWAPLETPLGEQCLGSSIHTLLLPRMQETCEEEDGKTRLNKLGVNLTSAMVMPSQGLPCPASP